MKLKLPLLFLLAASLPAGAHPALMHSMNGTGAAGEGFLHPLSGWDHLLVMVAVGLWAAQIGGRSLWLLPSSFVTAMVAGALFGLSGIAVPMAESGVFVSIVLLGTVLGLAWKPPVSIACLFAGAAGLCHGYAHGAEMTPGLLPGLYLCGMVTATCLLHALGAGMGVTLTNGRFENAIRAAGCTLLVVAACGS